MSELQRPGEVLDIARSIAGSERVEPESPLDQLQDRSVIERHPYHSRVVRLAAAQRRRDDGRNAEAEQRLSVYEVGIDTVVGGGAWRRTMVAEATPLVAGDHANGGAPARSPGPRL